jgi:hypothetical protein
VDLTHAVSKDQKTAVAEHSGRGFALWCVAITHCSYKYTVKTSNFGPHENFGPFCESIVASLDESCTKSEQNRICRSKVFLQLLFS